MSTAPPPAPPVASASAPAAGPPRGHQGAKSWPRRTVLEAAAVVAGAWLLSHGPFSGLPGAAPPALAALLVGARAGYTAGIAAGTAAAVFALGEAGLSPALLLSPLGAREVLPPIALALALGALGGLVGDAHRAALGRTRTEAAGWKRRHDEIKSRYDVIVAAKEAQDRRVVGQFHTMSTLYEAAKALDVLEPEAILPATLRLARDVLEADAVALYGVEGRELVLIDGLGEAPDRPRTLPLAGSLAGEALQARNARAFKPGGQPGAWLAAPLIGKDGRPRAVLVVERIAFLRLNGDSVQLLGLLAEWAGRALGVSETHAETRARQVLDPVTGVHFNAYMQTQLQREWDLARRYSLPLAVMLFRLPGLDLLPPDERLDTTIALAKTLRTTLRQIDPVGHYRTPDAFLAILPVTPTENAKMLADRLNGLVPGLRVAAVGREEGETTEALLQQLQRATGLGDVVEDVA